MEIKVDSEFASLCPPLTAEEFGTLEASIIAEGCTEALCAWQENGSPLLLDGHNRLGICRTHKVTFKTRLLQLADRNAARNWIINRQLGRRNVTEDQKSYLRGKRYQTEKKSAGKPEKKCDQNDHISGGDEAGRTSDKLSAEYGVGSATIRRDAKFADAIDTLAASSGERVRRDILSGELKMTKTNVVKLAALPPEKQRAAIAGGTTSIKKAVAPSKPRTPREGRKVSKLAVRATLAALQQLVRNLDSIGLAERVAKHLAAIGEEIENVRNRNSQ